MDNSSFFRMVPVNFFRRRGKVFIFFLVLSVTFLFTTEFPLRSNNIYPYNSYVGYPLTIYDHPYNIRINGTLAPNVCSSKNVVIIVHSKVTNFIKRTTIRKTWANRAVMSRFGLKVIFFLGKPFDEDIQSLVEEESLEFKDIVQGSFYDSYLNITHKAILAYRWITEFCTQPSVVVKVDDDVFVNVFRLYHSVFPEVRNETHKAWCHIKPAFKHRIKRKIGEKHRVSDHEFKGYSRYPMAACHGYFVIITQDSVRAIYEAAKRTLFFWIDDIHVYGTLCKAAGVQLMQIKGYLKLSNEKQAVKCFRSKDDICTLLGVLTGSPTSLETLWNNAVKQKDRYKRNMIQQ